MRSSGERSEGGFQDLRQVRRARPLGDVVRARRSLKNSAPSVVVPVGFNPIRRETALLEQT